MKGKPEEVSSSRLLTVQTHRPHRRTCTCIQIFIVKFLLVQGIIFYHYTNFQFLKKKKKTVFSREEASKLWAMMLQRHLSGDLFPFFTIVLLKKKRSYRVKRKMSNQVSWTPTSVNPSARFLFLANRPSPVVPVCAGSFFQVPSLVVQVDYRPWRWIDLQSFVLHIC